MTQDVLQSLTAVLYNRINKADTQSMKTIAVVTLFFLPATFVSAVFSTGIFDFHVNESASNPRVISQYGWVYLLVCLVLTSLTLVAWLCWYWWGNAWLDKLRLPQGKPPRKVKQAVPETSDDRQIPKVTTSAEQDPRLVNVNALVGVGPPAPLHV